MAGRNQSGASAAGWIVETARARAATAQQSPLTDELEVLGRLDSLSTLELQSLSVRLGQYVWNQRLNDADLTRILRALLQARDGDGGELPASHRAFFSVMSALVEALRYGDEDAVPHCEPWQIERAARDIRKDLKEECQVVDTLLVRSMLDPLIGGDRPAFRTLLATLGREVMTLAIMGTDGRLPGVTELFGYAQLRTLQDALNGVLQASRS